MIIHGGAGSGKYDHTDRRFSELRQALEVGMDSMKKGSSLDGVVASVEYMESSGIFNAGKGACLATDGSMILDAAVMRGDTRKGAGIGAANCTYHPVRVARWVMENTPHVLIAGEDVRPFAKKAGVSERRLRPTRPAVAKYNRLMEAPKGLKRNVELWKSMQEGSTVGAVALDSDGLASAAVSTGGMWLKLPGRIGDSAILGAGIYADGSGAACATGVGEEIIRNAMSFKACEAIPSLGAAGAASAAIKKITTLSGPDTAGVITVDRKGRVGYALNTEAMGRAWYDRSKGRVVVEV